MGSTGDNDQVERQIFDSAMKGKWNEVKKMYSEHPEVYTAKITREGDTTLHVAVKAGREEVVEKLVEILKSSKSLEGAKEALQVENERGNTPLHLAAALGSVRMCKCIATVDSRLIGHRNQKKETPFFLAAERGKKEAFLCLHHFCGGGDKGYSYCRNSIGDTILHSAIVGEYFDLASLIIRLYERLVHYVNEDGFSPLHVLASNPSAFRNEPCLGWFSEFIYQCTMVDEPKDFMDEYHDPSQMTVNPEPRYPENYQTCNMFFRLLRKVFRFPNRRDCEADSEYQADQRCKMCPPNYLTCIQAGTLIMFKLGVLVLGFMFKLGVLVLEFGLGAKLREGKEKHVWSVRIMNELLRHYSKHEYGDSNGQNPRNCSATPQTIRKKKTEKLLLIASKNGISEMVSGILELFPRAKDDVNSEGKNVMHLAVENRRLDVFKKLREKDLEKNLLAAADDEGNNVLHLAAMVKTDRPWVDPDVLLQMQWEILWYQFIKKKTPTYLLFRENKKGKTPDEIFSETHKNLVQTDSEWLNKTSDSCIIVATLITSVAFASSTTVPGGNDDKTGAPILEGQSMFQLFAEWSATAFYSSLLASTFFLSIITSRRQAMDFGTMLSIKLYMGLLTLSVSIGSMLESFRGGHFFVVRHLVRGAKDVEELTESYLLVIFFFIVHLPLYLKLLVGIGKSVLRFKDTTKIECY